MAEAVPIEKRTGHPLDMLVGTDIAVDPVGPDGQRRLTRVGDGLEPLDAAQLDGVAPIVIHVRPESADAGYSGMHVTIDCTGPVAAQNRTPFR